MFILNIIRILPGNNLIWAGITIYFRLNFDSKRVTQILSETEHKTNWYCSYFLNSSNYLLRFVPLGHEIFSVTQLSAIDWKSSKTLLSIHLLNHICQEPETFAIVSRKVFLLLEAFKTRRPLEVIYAPRIYLCLAHVIATIQGS